MNNIKQFTSEEIALLHKRAISCQDSFEENKDKKSIHIHLNVNKEQFEEFQNLLKKIQIKDSQIEYK
ncbi:MAG: hypothetical protein LBM96_05855 [Methanobrevibacter sp.]|jgi:hypothetical protein|nr:hypothetical protein [Candidatus Methanoflexus mossambicus]